MTDLRALLAPIRERAKEAGCSSDPCGSKVCKAQRDRAKLLAAIEGALAVADRWEEDFPHKAWQVRTALAAALGSDTTNQEGTQ